MLNLFRSIALFPLLTLILLSSSCAQHPDIPNEVPYGPKPETPSQAALSAIADQDAAELIRNAVEGEGGSQLYYFTLDGERFTGWSHQEFPDNEHRYRYTKYDDGWPVWQIGYYANGQRDMDFHMKRGKSLGSERMWRSDGAPYIDYFYSEIDQMHGVQQRWHAEGRLAYQAAYNHGELIYEISYAGDGEITDLKGEVPNELINLQNQ